MVVGRAPAAALRVQVFRELDLERQAGASQVNPQGKPAGLVPPPFVVVASMEVWELHRAEEVCELFKVPRAP